MSIAEFFSVLSGLNIHLWLENDQLRFRAPAGTVTPEIKSELIKRKPEIIDLLRQLSTSVGQHQPILPVKREHPIPLTFAQERLWFLDQLHPGAPTYNVCDVIEVPHAINILALKRALNEIVRRHEILRTGFPAVDGVPRQEIVPPFEVSLPVHDYTGLPEKEQMARVHHAAIEDSKTGFDLSACPLFRVALVKLSDLRYIWMLTIHHIISDDWSKKYSTRNWIRFMARFRRGGRHPCRNRRSNGPISPCGKDSG